MRTGQGPIWRTVTGAICPFSSYTCVIPTFRPIRPSGMAHHLLTRDTDSRGTACRPCHDVVHRKSYYGGRGRNVQGRHLLGRGEAAAGAAPAALANLPGSVKMAGAMAVVARSPDGGCSSVG